MPALTKKVQFFIFLTFSLVIILTSGSVLAVGKSSVGDLNYHFQGRRRQLSFVVNNFSSRPLQPEFKVVVSGANGKVKHSWIFNRREMIVLPHKQGRFTFTWDDKIILSGQERVELYQLVQGKWQLVGQQRSDWSFVGLKKPLFMGVIASLILTPLVLLRNFPNKLLSFFSREEVRVDAQESA